MISVLAIASAPSGFTRLMISIHQRLGVALLVLGFFGTVWGIRGVVRRVTDPGFRTYCILLFVAIVVQAAFGLVLAAGLHQHPADVLHWLYGGLALISLPLAYMYAQTKSGRGEAVFMMLGALAVFLFSVRTLMTG